jgi:NitT/TauT family transport system substrate-binding protein
MYFAILWMGDDIAQGRIALRLQQPCNEVACSPARILGMTGRARLGILRRVGQHPLIRASPAWNFKRPIMRRGIHWFAVASVLGGLAALLAIGPMPPANAQASEKLTVRFTWKLKGEYAPLFVALDKGYYKAEGLDVDLAEGSGAQTVLKLLAAGTEKFGYGPAVSAATAISQGLPVKVVALYQTEAPMGVISFPDVPLKTPKDLEGKRLAISVGETFSDMLAPFCRVNGVDIGKIQQIQMETSVRSAQFLTRKIDVMSAYLSNELPLLSKRANVKFNVLRVSEFGLRLVGASLFVGNAFAEQNPQIVKKLIAATSRGYQDAIANPKDAARIMNKYMKIPEQADVLEAQVEATTVSTNAPKGKPIGWQEAADWEATLKLLKETGGIAALKPLDAYYTNAFLQ